MNSVKLTESDLAGYQQPTPTVQKREAIIGDPDKLAVHEDLLASVIPNYIKENMSNKENTPDVESTAPKQVKSIVTKEERQTVYRPAPKLPDKELNSMFPIDDLPSLYAYYDTKIYGRPLNVRELKKLASISSYSASEIIDDVLTTAIKGVDHDKILSYDKLAIIFWLRAITYPQSGYSVPFYCSKCGSEASYDFKVSNISMTSIGNGDIGDSIEIDGHYLTFKYLTIGDEKRINRFTESVKKSLTKYDMEIVTLAAQVSEFDSNPAGLMDMHNFINSSPQNYSRVISHLTQFVFGIDEHFNVICNGCGGESQEGITFRSSFFIPEYRS